VPENPVIVVRKKGGHGHGHHGGAWKVAYADFVTAMMAFFMVMWIMGMSQEDREIIAGYFRDPIGFTANPPKSKVNILPDAGPTSSKGASKGTEDQRDAEQQKAAEIAGQLREAAEADAGLAALEHSGAFKVALTPEGVRIELAENESNSELFFKLGSAEVQPRAREVLARLAPILASFQRPIVVDGHTDARPLGRHGYDNFDLSHDRANAVRRLLHAGGVPQGQVLAVRGFADRKPRSLGRPLDFSNRRVEILIPYRYAQEQVTGPVGGPLDGEVEGVFRFPDKTGE
jgi:chemotaxis protein MotB